MIAICSMITKPLNFETWLIYHFNLGIGYIFLRVEDTPELKEIIYRYHDKISVDYYNNIDKLDNYQTIQTRQIDFINNSIDICNTLPIRWLFHIDSDELIFTKQPLINILSNVSIKYNCIHFQNYEAVYSTDNLSNPFINTNHFIKCNSGKCLSYANGKSAGRISQTLRSRGPHYFEGDVYDINENLVTILHFDSPTFDKWYDKFSNLSNFTLNNFNKIPFKFYQDSINIIKKGNITEARKFYNKMKVYTYNNKDVIKINF